MQAGGRRKPWVQRGLIGPLTPPLILIILVVVLVGGYCASQTLMGGDDSTPTDSSENPDNGGFTNGGNNTGSTPGSNPTARPTQGSNNGGQPTANSSNLPRIEVGTLAYGTYHSAIGAQHFAQDRGLQISPIDLGGEEGLQCNWVAGRPTGSDRFPQATTDVPRILFTTHNAARLCEGVKIVMVIDQSSGADMIVTREGISDFSQLFTNPVIMPGECSVSEYLYRTVAWAFGATDASNIRFGDNVTQSVASFVDDNSIQSVVAYVPDANDALEVSGSKKFMTTENWAGILDVAVIRAEDATNPTIQKFLASWFDFVKLESQNFDEAWNILAEYHGSHPENTFLGAYDAPTLKDELENLVAQASFSDNVQMLVKDTSVVEARLSEVDSIQRDFPCTREGQVPSPSPFSPKEMIDGRYISALQSDGNISSSPRTISKRRVALSTTVPLETAVGGASEKLVGQLNAVFIEFQPDSDQFVNELAARDVIERNFTPILRLTNNSVLELVGGFAAPRGCINCDDASGSELAIKRAQRVRQLLIELGIDPNRVRVNPTARPPANRGSGDPTLVSQDRRVEGKLLIVGGQ